MNERIIYENKSLKFLFNTINLGLLDIDNDYDDEDLIIFSNKYPDVQIRCCNCDLEKFICNKLIKEVKDIELFESNTYNFIAFIKTINEDNKTILLTTPVMELLITSILNENKEVETWNFESLDWSLKIIEQ